MRGLLFGLFAFAGFFLTVASLLPVAGIALSFTTALAVAVLIQASTLRLVRRAVSAPIGTAEPVDAMR